MPGAGHFYMKNFLLSLVVFLSCLIPFTNIKAEYTENTVYNYGFILSCGKVIYRSYTYELSGDTLAGITDILEEFYCKNLE